MLQPCEGSRSSCHSAPRLKLKLSPPHIGHATQFDHAPQTKAPATTLPSPIARHLIPAMDRPRIDCGYRRA
ncbi:hypothetical protein CEXT_126851 [Caerostris extrusa]|uniref:Uncharacterized protein n=1 Tax=Caerostris extrusa TaxID=172846 RepID=A0AAV4XV80_CAEEX|nr:hypothetical protein CEXT_126851 [Caerostris extrusa]